MTKMFKKIIQWLKKDVCKKCIYYNMSNNPPGWCQSKKVGNNGSGEVTWFDRHFCEPIIIKDRKK